MLFTLSNSNRRKIIAKFLRRDVQKTKITFIPAFKIGNYSTLVLKQFRVPPIQGRFHTNYRYFTLADVSSDTHTTLVLFHILHPFLYYIPFHPLLSSFACSEANNMVFWLPSIKYSSTSQGYWAPVTSTINWCEEVCRPYLTLKRHASMLIYIVGLLRHSIFSRDRQHSDKYSIHISCIQGHRQLRKIWP